MTCCNHVDSLFPLHIHSQHVVVAWMGQRHGATHVAEMKRWFFILLRNARGRERNLICLRQDAGGWEIKRRNSILILYVSHFSTFCVFFHSASPTVNIIAGNRRKKRKFDLMQKLFSSLNGCVFGGRTRSKPRCDGGSSASCWERRKWGSKKKTKRWREIQQKFSLLTNFSLCLASLPPSLSTQFHHKFHLSSTHVALILFAFPIHMTWL